MGNPNNAPLISFLMTFGEVLLYVGLIAALAAGLSILIAEVWAAHKHDREANATRRPQCYHGVSRHDPDWEV